MSLLEITGLTHSYGDNRLFKEATAVLNKGEHIGVVGQNGAGKSTLIKLCTGQIVPDEGRIVWQPKITIGYLDQYAKTDPGITMKEFLQTAFQELYEIEEKMNRLYIEAAEDVGLLKEAYRYQEYLEIKEFYGIETRIDQVVTGLGLSETGLERPLNQMSGGQRAKAVLAKLLLQKPSVLLLDEPTNFLDKEHVAWLSDYLSTLENAVIVVSHDSEFLENAVNYIWDIDNCKIQKYYGTYLEFLKKKTQLREDYIRQYSSQQKEIKKTEEFIRKNIAGRKSKMARGRKKQLERMDKMEALDRKEIKPFFHFQELPLAANEPLKVKRISVGYEYPVLSGIDFAVKEGQKVVITGFNGIGKSTLLKTLIGQIPCLDGTFSFSEQAVIGYYEQDLRWADQEMTPLEIVEEAYPELVVKEVRRHLARCGITRQHALQPVQTLSGGEQSKVKMCLLTLKPCNFLILDEPTNHLDVQAKEALRAALCEFKGNVLLVSHEEAFYRGWVQRVIHVDKNRKRR